MVNITVTSWFILKAYLPLIGGNAYVLHKPEKNMRVELTTKNKLPYNVNSWIKLTLNMDCEIHDTVPVRYFCKSKEYRVEECNIYNSFTINGVQYC